MTTPNLQLTVPGIGAAGPGYGNNYNDDMAKIEEGSWVVAKNRCVADGLTDDTTAFQNAGNDAAASNVPFYVRGTYAISQFLAPTNLHMYLFGTLLKYNGHTGSNLSVFFCSGVSNVRVEGNGKIDSGDYRTPYAGRSFIDGQTTSGSNILTSPALASFVAGYGDTGRTITGSGIPSSTTVTAVLSATQVQMSANATATATDVHVTLGVAATSRSCVGVTGASSNIRLRGITLTNAGRDCVNIYSVSAGVYPTDVVVESCPMTFATRCCVALTAGADCKVRDSILDGGGMMPVDIEPNAGFPALRNNTFQACVIKPTTLSTGCLNATIGGATPGSDFGRINFLYNYIYGVPNFDGSQCRVASLPNSRIIGNWVDGAASIAFSATGSTGTRIIDNHSINGGTLTGDISYTGPSITTAAIFCTSDRASIRGNVIEGCDWSGICVSTCDNTGIIGNDIYNCGRGYTTYAFDGPGVYCYNTNFARIMGNGMVDDQGTKTMSYGWRVRQSGTTITGNKALGNAVNGYRVAEFSATAGTGGTINMFENISINGLTVTQSNGTPEGSITAPVGSLHLRTAGSPTGLYVKETGTGNTGWVHK